MASKAKPTIAKYVCRRISGVNGWRYGGGINGVGAQMAAAENIISRRQHAAYRYLASSWRSWLAASMAASSVMAKENMKMAIKRLSAGGISECRMASGA